jgi:predicted Zn-dependent protease
MIKDDLRMLLARAAAVSLAVVVCAWFALGIRQADDTNTAASIVGGASTLSAQQGAHADSVLRAAGTLNPDSQVDLLRGAVALREHQQQRAARILESVVAREPMNVEAWALLAQAAFGNGPLVNEALAHIGLLDPRGGR